MSKIGILNDEVASSRGDVAFERAEIMGEIGASWGGGISGAELVWSSSDPGSLSGAPALDMLVVDYGALSGRSGALAASMFTRAVRDWADEHGSTLVVLWTDFTEEAYADVFAEAFGEVAQGPLVGNILFRYGRNPYVQSFRQGREASGFWEVVRAWLPAGRARRR